MSTNLIEMNFPTFPLISLVALLGLSLLAIFSIVAGRKCTIIAVF